MRLVDAAQSVAQQVMVRQHQAPQAADWISKRMVLVVLTLFMFIAGIQTACLADPFIAFWYLRTVKDLLRRVEALADDSRQKRRPGGHRR